MDIRAPECMVCAGVTEDEALDIFARCGLNFSDKELVTLPCEHTQWNWIFCFECKAVPFAGLVHGQWEFAHREGCPQFPREVPLPVILKTEPLAVYNCTRVIRCRVLRSSSSPFPTRFSSYDFVCNWCQKYVSFSLSFSLLLTQLAGMDAQRRADE